MLADAMVALASLADVLSVVSASPLVGAVAPLVPPSVAELGLASVTSPQPRIVTRNHHPRRRSFTRSTVPDARAVRKATMLA
jgi:hypothetical protein